MRHPQSQFIRSILIAVIWLFTFQFAVAVSVVMAQEASTGEAETQSTAADDALIERLKKEDVDSIMASLSDEQVRRLLLLELQRQADQQALDEAQQDQVGGLAGFIQNIKNKIEIIKWEIAFLQSGGDTAPSQVPDIFIYLGQGDRDSDPIRAIWSVVVVFAAGFLGQWLFYLYSASARHRIEETVFPKWFGRLAGLFSRSILELASLVIFVVVVLTVFYLFFDRTTPQRVLVATYLAAVLIVQGVMLILRFLLAPKHSSLRVLPLSDSAARYLFNWITAITVVGSFGMLTCGVIRVAGASEAAHFKMVSLVALIIVLMLIVMIIQKRKPVAESLSEGLPLDSIRYRMANKWHHFAIIATLVLFVSAEIYSLLGSNRYPGMKTLILVALYFPLDWGLRQILNVAFGLAQQPHNLEAAFTASSGDDEESASDDELSTKDEQTPSDDTTEVEKADAAQPPINISRMKRVIRAGLRIALGALVIFWILNVWGVELQIGQAVARAAFNILVVVLICYVAWEVVSAAIQRRMQEVAPDEDMEEMEEGGAGGSRIGTLLVLLRKFFLVVIIVMATLIIMSAVGVNIGPLIAGAGVIGLAIGFGSQTLVKDIIAGIFFLIDDAFRVGDYIQTSGSKGLVEHISLRSLRLRHPRGMVNTIPFGSMGTVTNFSRDYIITKLNFRVRYDTDVEKVRKLIKKKVYKVIMKDETLAPKLLGKIKSQGVREMDDAAMVMRIKYKTRPGDQFAIRKEVYRLMQEAFQEEGIELNPQRNVTVYMPPELTQAARNAEGKLDPNVIQAGAAAALTTQLEEEEKRKAEAAANKEK